MTFAGRDAARKLLASALLPALAACAGAPTDPDAPRVVTGVRIAPYERHEDCMALENGDRLDFRFESQFPVAFSLLYREGTFIVIPLSREQVQEFAGVFASTASRPYCLRLGSRPAGRDPRLPFSPSTPGHLA